MSEEDYDYEGPQALREPIARALRGVVDPEMALSIVDVGLVRRVRVDAERVQLSMTMTSAACPVADVIVDDVGEALAPLAPPGAAVEVELVWEPPWTPECMSRRAREFMGW